MNGFKSKSSGIPEMPSGATGIDFDRIAELKRDVLRESVDRRKSVAELAKELKEFGPMAAAIIIAMVFAPLMEQDKKEKEEKKGEAGKPAESPSVPVVPSTAEKPAEPKPETPEKKEPPRSEEAAAESAEMPNASDIVIIGDSIPKGMISRFREGKKPDFIGEVGRSTPAILTDVKNNPEKLRNKKTVIISCGGNDMVTTDNYEQVADNIDAIVKECEKAGIKEIIILTRFPYQKDYTDKPYLRDRSRNLREVILRRFHGPRVKVVDLYKHFVDENGNLKRQYTSTGRDKLHPVRAYRDALGIIERESGVNLEGLVG